VRLHVRLESLTYFFGSCFAAILTSAATLGHTTGRNVRPANLQFLLPGQVHRQTQIVESWKTTSGCRGSPESRRKVVARIPIFGYECDQLASAGERSQNSKKSTTHRTRVFALNYGSSGKPERRASMIMLAQTVPRRKTLRRNLKAMNADGFSFSVMVGIAETYVPAFVLARGLGELNAALIATVPVLLGSILQLLAPMALQRLKSYRRFVVMTASIQASSMLVLMCMALMPHVPAWAVFVPATLYWAAGLSTGPAWNTWVEYLVPQKIRSGFFARRSLMCHVGVLLGLIAGGLFLRWSVAHEMTVAVFAVLFGIGAIGRFVSAGMLARQTEHATSCGTNHFHNPLEENDEYTQADEDTDAPSIMSAKARFAAVIQAVKKPGSAGRLILFLMAVQTAVHVSGPYFNPYMLRILKLSWMEYMGLLSLGFIGKMISLPWAGRFANRFGPDRLLWVGSIGIVPVSAMWFFSQNIFWLASIQIVSGLVWGCYELAMLLQFFRQIPGERRVAVLTLYNLGNSAAMVFGTVIGGVILNALGRGMDAYLTLFVVSGCMRFFALLAMPDRQTAVHTTRGVVSKWVVQSVRGYVHSAHSIRAVQEIHIEIPQRPENIDIVLSNSEGSSVTSRVIIDDGGVAKRRDGSTVTQRGAMSS